MQTMNSSDIVRMLTVIADSMSEKRSLLIELDSAIGDGDLGITMEKGFSAAAEFAKRNETLEPGMILMKSGMEIVKVAPSTMGTLMGTGLMRGGKAVVGKAELSVADMTLFFEGFLSGVLDRGRAKPGEKTIVDVLIPAVEAMKVYRGDDIGGLLSCAVAGAEKGIENEKGMISQHGKAAVFREKTRELKDPGSEAVFILIVACRKSVA